MKFLISGIVLCSAAAAFAVPAQAQTNVSISVGQPGFYGRVDIGDYVPRPVLYAPQPIIVTPAPHYVAEPVYLRVPPGHRRHWSRFCGRYGACGRPVLFVRDDWYTNTYVPLYRERHGGYRDGYGHGGYREPVRVVERVEYRDHDRGHGPHGGWDRGRGPGEWHGEGHGPGPGRGHGEGHGGGHGEGHGHGHR
jgi:hypothetical protein